jgi:hypothetical protein
MGLYYRRASLTMRCGPRLSRVLIFFILLRGFVMTFEKK